MEKLILTYEGTSCAWITTSVRSLEKVIEANVKTYNQRLKSHSRLNLEWWKHNMESHRRYLPIDFMEYCSKELPYPIEKITKDATIFLYENC